MPDFLYDVNHIKLNVFLDRLLGKPSKHEWPEESTTIKWNSFDVINQIRLEHFCPYICETAQDLIMVRF